MIQLVKAIPSLLPAQLLLQQEYNGHLMVTEYLFLLRLISILPISREKMMLTAAQWSFMLRQPETVAVTLFLIP
jgi:hypothetical protein